MKEWICREMSTSTGGNENGVLMMEIELIRCKDCKHMVEHKGYGYLGESVYTCESNMDGWILPDSYCSMAERKEEK